MPNSYLDRTDLNQSDIAIGTDSDPVSGDDDQIQARAIIDGYITDRNTPWQTHNPEFVHIAGNTAQKNSSDQILQIDGQQMSPTEAYDLAKNHGNLDAALAYARYVVDSNPEAFEAFKAQYQSTSPIIVPVVALERTKNGKYHYNAIPDAFAAILSEKTGWPIQGEGTDDRILQNNKAGRTGSSPMDRMVRHPSFQGKVDTANYVIVDDHFSNGGTFRALLDYIESNGGKVVGATALIGRGGTAGVDQFRPTQRLYNQITGAIGKECFSELHERFFGVPCHDIRDCRFTAGEIRQIRSEAKEIETIVLSRYDKGKNNRAPVGKQLQALVYKEIENRVDHAIRRKTDEIASHSRGRVNASGTSGSGETERSGSREIQETLERSENGGKPAAVKEIALTPVSYPNPANLAAMAASAVPAGGASNSIPSRVNYADTPEFYEIGRIIDPDSVAARAFDAQMQALAERLAGQHYDPTRHRARYLLSDDPTPNAYTIPGSNPPVIVLHRGLIEYAKSLDEVAGVLAHEWGHIIAEQELGLRSNSKAQEAGADMLAVKLLADAGMDARALEKLFERMERDYGSADTSAEFRMKQVLQDVHPLNENRAAIMHDQRIMLQREGLKTDHDPSPLPPEILSTVRSADSFTSKMGVEVELRARGYHEKSLTEKMAILAEVAEDINRRYPSSRYAYG